ncbi:hypothetical protein IC582_003051 [Cucumis melo]|uniref:Uncharacterized protein LOC103492302 n=1 Tax=Cucumis melo TaxID=3656 RepID=A0A1S3BQ57_CUCME|nr:uncharacterized protein LOC103492302 [Cucumis melo]
MALGLVESMESINPLKKNPFLGENYEFTLEQSIQNVLAEIRKGNVVFSRFTEGFYKLIQARADPPLESIWFYSALTFRSSFNPKGDFLERVAAMKVLFQLVCSCSAPCGSSKTITLLSPVVSEVYKLVIDMRGKDLNSKREKKAMREVKSLVEAILGLTNLSSCEDSNKNDKSLDFNFITPFVDLISIWTHPNEGLDQFLPLVCSEVREEFSSGECDVRRLAGVVIAETFLVKLCLDFNCGHSRQALEEDLRNWTVGSITRIRNFYFFETLVRLLLEATLPVTSLLSTDDEALLRKVLSDALILVDYSFLKPEKAINLPAEHTAFLAVKRLILTYEATEFYRKHGDQNRAISYLNAFSSSLVSSQIIRWVKSQMPSNENLNHLNGSSPKVFLEWLLKAEDQGVRVFDNTISNHRAKIVLDTSKSVLFEGDKVDDDLLFYIDKQGENENGREEDKTMDKSVNAALVSVAHTMSTTENSSVKKRSRKAKKRNKKKNADTSQLKSAVENNDTNGKEDTTMDESVNAALVSVAPTMSTTENSSAKKRSKKAKKKNKRIKIVQDGLVPNADATQLKSAVENNDTDVKEDTTMDESVNAALVSVDCTMSTTENSSVKKRSRKAKKKNKTIKFVKDDLVPNADATQLKSAVENNDTDSKEDTAMDESVNAAPVSVACTMSTTENSSVKKLSRKAKKRNKRIKLVQDGLVLNIDATQLKSAVESNDTDGKDTTMDESVNAALVSVALTMSTTENSSVKKLSRKAKRKNKKIKVVKDDLVPNADAATQLKSAVEKNGTDSKGEVHNPLSYEDSDMKE